jgi:tetratricopeptide (TPR) repeat protein
MINFALAGLTALAILWVVWPIITTDVETVGYVTAILALAVNFGSLFFPRPAGKDDSTQPAPRHQLGQTAVRLVILLAILFGRSPLLTLLAEQQFDAALANPASESAKTALRSASRLGSDVDTILMQALNAALDAPRGSDNDQRAVNLAELLSEFAPDAAAEHAPAVRSRVETSASQHLSAETQRYVRVLATLDGESASELAGEFNATAVDLLTSASPDVAGARVYLESVAALDEAIDTGRTPTEQGITRYNLGYVYELQNDLTAAADAYRAAIQQDSQNLEAHYALSSLLLIHFPEDAALLNEAVAVAEEGHAAIDPQFCGGEQDLADDDTVVQTWHCFALLMTEAGARLERGNADLGDIPQTIRGLLGDATRLAEANDQFAVRPGFYTAEAYYYLAQVTGPDTPVKTLCAIIEQHNFNNPRHRNWVAYANEQLGERECP